MISTAIFARISYRLSTLIRPRRWTAPILLSSTLALVACGGGTSSAENSGAVTDMAASCGSPSLDAASLEDAALVLRVAGTDPGVTYDVLEVGGVARLGGQLQVVFEDGYTPSAGQKFTFVRARCLIGAFKKVSSNKAVSFAILQNSNSLTLEVK